MDPLASFALAQIRTGRSDLASSALPHAPTAIQPETGVARRRVAAALQMLAVRLDPTPVAQPRGARSVQVAG